LADSHVWRAGWPEWRRASQAAAELPAPLTTAIPLRPTAADDFAEPERVSVIVTGNSPNPTSAVRRRRSAKRQLSTAIFLLILVLILGAILLWVLQREPDVAAQPTGCPSAQRMLG
jgi:hypothetical protein